MYLTFLETEAAATGAPAQNSWLSLVLMLGFMGVAFYFFIFRPQKKQEREVNNMRNNIIIGDEISTNAGIIGRVVNIKDDLFTIEINSERTKMKVFRWAIRAVEVPAPRPDAEQNESSSK